MFKFLLGLTLTILILGCNSVNKKENTILSSTHIDTTKLFKDIECIQKVKTFGMTEETLRKFLNEITESENTIENLALVFYKEEGEVINLYKAGIVTHKNRSKIFYSLNNNKFEIDEIKNTNILNTLTDKIEELNTPTNRRLLIIEINKDKYNCTIFKNIKAIETLENRLVF